MPAPPPPSAAALGVDATDRLLRGLLLGGLLLVIARTAWVAEDAFITLRTVDNLVHGYGAVWNTFERVQAYTHPLWMLLLTLFYVVTEEAFFTTIFVGAACSFAAARLVACRLCPTPRQGVLALLVLLLSRSFIDFATSGLENPLLYLLLALFVLVYTGPAPRRLARLSLLTALILLTRLDAALFVGPALLVALRGAPWRSALHHLALGLLPFVAWELFSVVYYGFPFPNTAYAKLAHQLPAAELAQQGLIYYLHQLSHDPLSLAVIGAALVGPVVLRARPLLPLALGLALYLLYVLKIGGDFMAGRFLAAPLLFAVAILARLDLRLPGYGVLGVGALIALLGLGVRRPTVTSDEDYGETRKDLIDRGVADERAFFYPHAGLLRYERGRKMPTHPWLKSAKNLQAHPEKVHVMLGIGMIGHRAGPDVRMVDIYGLADPLLARLPAIAGDKWRIGHFARHVPAGYLTTLETGDPCFADPGLAELHRQLRLVTAGPLWSAERWAAIVRLNLGRVEPPFDAEFLRAPLYRSLPLCALRRPKDDGHPWDEFDAHKIAKDTGLRVDLPGLAHQRALDLALAGERRYRVELRRDDEIVWTKEIEVKSAKRGGLRRLNVAVPAAVAAAGYDAVHLFGLAKDGKSSVGHLLLVDSAPPEPTAPPEPAPDSAPPDSAAPDSTAPPSTAPTAPTTPAAPS